MGSVAREDDLVVLDGAADSNTGQLFRMAMTYSAITLKPVRIENIWATKTPINKRGMTASLVAIVRWFAKVTDAQVQGDKVGSMNLEFRPKHRGSPKLIKNEIKVTSGSMTASAILTFQAIFPLLLMIGGNPKANSFFDLYIDGATNCPEAPSFEYLDQVFFPAVQAHFGIEVICKLERRGWGQMTPGTVRKGTMRIKFRPLEVGSTIKVREDARACEPDVGLLDTYIQNVVVSIIAPVAMHNLLKEALTADIGNRFHEANVIFRTVDDSEHCDRVYVLLVAHSDRYRWARDMINSESLKDRDLESLTKNLSSELCKDLEDEVNAEVGGECPVDQFLQDQLVVFQTLAEGRSCFPRQSKDETPEDVIKHLDPDCPLVVHGPTRPSNSLTSKQHDSQHTLLARYVASKMLPKVEFYNEGKVCIGAGIKVGEGIKKEGKRQALEPQV